MTPIALSLVVVSAVIHAGWNLLSKSRHPSASFFLLSSVFGAALLSPILILHVTLLAHIPVRVWVLLGLTGLFMATYYASLAGAYRSGHMSVAYPMARSFPVIVVFAVALLLGRGDQVTAQCILGTILVVGGCFLIPMRRFADFRIADYINLTCGLALLAAIGSAGYTVVDDEALRHLRDAQTGLGTIEVSLLYACLEAAMSAVWLAAFVMPRSGGRAGFRREVKSNARHAAVAGVAIWLAYALVLISLAFVRNVSYVAAFRQFSIPLGTLFGIAILKEPPYRPKLAGVAIVFLGLLLVALG
jgi:drug/metabolite transporter (DMT)-like permease